MTHQHLHLPSPQIGHVHQGVRVGRASQFCRRLGNTTYPRVRLVTVVIHSQPSGRKKQLKGILRRFLSACAQLSRLVDAATLRH